MLCRSFYSLLGVSAMEEQCSYTAILFTLSFYSLLGVSPLPSLSATALSSPFLLPFGSFLEPLSSASVACTPHAHPLSTPFWEFPVTNENKINITNALKFFLLPFGSFDPEKQTGIDYFKLALSTPFWEFQRCRYLQKMVIGFG